MIVGQLEKFTTFCTFLAVNLGGLGSVATQIRCLIEGFKGSIPLEEVLKTNGYSFYIFLDID